MAETTQDKNRKDTAVEEGGEFDAAFDEATGKTKPADAAAGKTGGAAAEGEAAGETDSDADTAGGDADTDAGGEAGADEGAGEAAAGADGEGDSPQLKALKQQLSDLELRTKNWDGRLSASDRERNALKEERDALAAKVAKLEEQVKAGTTTADESDVELEELRKQYPDYTPKVWALLERRLKKAKADADSEVDKRVKAAIDERLKPIETGIEKEKRDAHFNTIREKHSDFAETAASREMQEWIASKPEYLRGGLTAVLQRGSAAQVIGLLDDFKLAMKDKKDAADKVAADLKAKRKDQEKAAGAVPGRTGGVPASARQVDKNDFNGAWDEATKK